MWNKIVSYTNWLHTRWPAGVVEKLPEVHLDGTTNVPGVYVVGDLTGIPLLKFSADTGAKAVFHILNDSGLKKSNSDELVDIAIIGAGVSGISAAIEAKKAGLSYKLFEASETFSTVVNFPKGKPIYTYPTDMKPAGGLNFTANVKEELLEEMDKQTQNAGVEVTPARITKIYRKSGELILLHQDEKTTRAQKVIVAIGRSGNFRKIGCSGENMEHVYNRLHDPKEFINKHVLIVGGGDSALEAAIAIACCGGHVTLSYRKEEFQRPKPDNIQKIHALTQNPSSPVSVEKPTSERVTTAAHFSMRGDNAPGSLTLKMASNPKEIKQNQVILKNKDGDEETVNAEAVFSMIGREAPLDFFRRSGINILGEWRTKTWVTFSLFTLFCIFLYHWKSGSSWLYSWWKGKELFPFNIPDLFARISVTAKNPENLFGTLSISMESPGFYYGLAYCILVVIFGIRRIKKRKTPYVKVQTITLAMIQIFPLFLFPYVIFPWAGHNGFFDSGWMKSIADSLFPICNYDHGREYWRAYGLILAWPLFVYNVFTESPMWGWLAISVIQTFVIIPLMVWKWGKGAYCGWVCSCGALAETLGDEHRHKMPHGPFWNRMNMVGQVILWLALFLFALRFITWFVPIYPLKVLYDKLFSSGAILGIQLNYAYIVDLFLAGIVGVAAYFWFSGRVWCRFACPLAALMHIYARFSKFRIFSNKSKCISCNVCTSVCHQGIDIMNFANKGLPMQDPECVRCSACVQQCPTGTLSFGEFRNGEILKGWLQASPVQVQETQN